MRAQPSRYLIFVTVNIILGVMAIFALLLLSNAPPASAAPPTPEQAAEQAILSALDLDLAAPGEGVETELSTVNVLDTWAFAALTLKDAASHEPLASDPLYVLARQAAGGEWAAALPGSPLWNAWLADAPVQLLPLGFAELYGNYPAQPATTVVVGHNVPWSNGEKATVTTSPQTSGHIDQMDFDLWRGSSVGSAGDIAATKGGKVRFAKDSSSVTCEFRDSQWYYNGTSTPCPWTEANLIVIEHEANEYTYYLHLAPGSIPAELRTVGTSVKAGQKIGVEGNTGWSRGVHLHFFVGDTYTVGTSGMPWDSTPIQAEFTNADDVLRYSDFWRGREITADYAVATPVDVALIIDSSGSMTSNDPRNLRKTAANVFIDTMQDDDQVAVVDFDEGVRVPQSLRRVGSDRSAAHAAVNTVDSYGGTNIRAGLQTGYNQLNTSTTKYPKAAVFMTDGDDSVGNTDAQILSVAAQYAAKGWRIFTVGLIGTGGVNEVLLKRIASDTGGQYTRLTSADQLIQVYFEIQRLVSGGQSIYDRPTLLLPGQTQTIAVALPADQTTANFLVSWPGSTVDTTLVDPTGRVITPGVADQDPYIDHQKGLTYELYRVTNPRPGAWQVSIYGADLPAGGEQVSIQVAVRAPADGKVYLPLVLRSGTAVPVSPTPTTTPTYTPTATPTHTPTPTNTPVPAGPEAQLWSLPGYTGGKVWSGQPGFSNAPTANSYSLWLPAGWSARTWRGDHRSGEERCWQGPAANLQDTGWHLAIESIEVFNFNVCPPPVRTFVPAARLAGPPWLDGDLGEWDSAAGALLNDERAAFHEGWQPHPAAGDLSALLFAGWDPGHLYLAAYITDDMVIGNESANIWHDDDLEIGIQAGGHVRQFAFGYGRPVEELIDGGTRITPAVIRSVVPAPGGWIIEAAIPAAELGEPALAVGQGFAFTIGYWDDDDGGNGDTHLILWGNSTNSGPSQWGTIVLQ